MLPTLPQTTEESSLNESPSKKEGKYSLIGLGADLASLPQ